MRCCSATRRFFGLLAVASDRKRRRFVLGGVNAPATKHEDEDDDGRKQIAQGEDGRRKAAAANRDDARVLARLFLSASRRCLWKLSSTCFLSLPLGSFEFVAGAVFGRGSSVGEAVQSDHPCRSTQPGFGPGDTKRTSPHPSLSQVVSSAYPSKVIYAMLPARPGEICLVALSRSLLPSCFVERPCAPATIVLATVAAGRNDGMHCTAIAYAGDEPWRFLLWKAKTTSCELCARMHRNVHEPGTNGQHTDRYSFSHQFTTLFRLHVEGDPVETVVE